MTIDRRKLLGLGAVGAMGAGAGLTGFLPKVLAWFRPAALLGPIERVDYTPGHPAGEFEDLPANLVAHGPIEFEFDFEPTIEQGVQALDGNEFRVQFPDGEQWVFSGYVTNWNVHPLEGAEHGELGVSVAIQPTGVRFDGLDDYRGADVVDLDAEGGPRLLSDGLFSRDEMRKRMDLD